MTMLQHGLVPSTGGYQIERSLRFNSADSAYLNRTPASATNRTTWTWSGWVKRSGLGTTQYIFAGGQTTSVRFESDDTINFYSFSSQYDARINTSQVFRDVGAWYHIVAVFNTGSATTTLTGSSTDRMRLYVNGTQVSNFSATVVPSQNFQGYINNNEPHMINARYNGSYVDTNGNWYMTEVQFIDGSALTAASFGETDTDTGVWKPKAYTGTYGTNGFFLKFADSSGTTSTTLGKDSSGNGNNWTPNNFSVTAGAGNDSLVDTPTPYGTDTGAGGEVRGNYATFNPTAVSGMGLATLENGNLYAIGGGSGTLFKGAVSTIAMSTGKWYWETTIVAGGTNYGPGIVASKSLASAIGGSYGYADASDAWIRSNTGVVYNNGGAAIVSLSTFTTDDVISIAVDFDAGKLWFAKNGTWDSSGNPATGSNATVTFTPGGKSFYAAVQGWVYAPYTLTMALNAGQRPFAYTAPSGFKALCTQNLPTPNIGATSATQAQKYFDTTLYTGNGSAGRVITTNLNEVGLAWVKIRSGADDHRLANIVTGGNKHLKSNTTEAESTSTNVIQAFSGATFTVGSDTSVNANTSTYVAWSWAGNGAGSTNTQGTITSTVSASTTAGFSIVTYTGNGTNNATVGHGLGVAPAMIILKNRDGAYGWLVLHTSVGLTGTTLDGSPEYYMLTLNTTDARTDFTNDNIWNPTSTTFKINGAGTGNYVNANGIKYVAYCFAPVAGYSAFGSYTGNGSTDGPFVYTGFRPKWILIKPSSIADSWQIEDAARSPFNVVNDQLFPSNSNAEQVDSATRNTDFLSNGFKIRGTNGGINQSSETYVYACFAENPFKYSLAR